MFLKKAKTLYDTLKREVFRFPGTKDIFTYADMMGGIFLSGSPRSGKSSFVLRFILRHWFRDYGAFVSTTRLNDAEQISSWAREVGAADRTVLFDANSGLSFNILEYELNKPGGGDTNALVDLIMQIQELVSNFQAGGASSKSDDSYWRDQTRDMLSMTIELRLLAKMPITWKSFRKTAIGAFDEEQLHRYHQLWDIINTSEEDSEEWISAFNDYRQWRSRNWFIDAFDTADLRDDLTLEEEGRLEMLREYWMVELPYLSPKPKSIVKSMLNSICRPFETKGILRDFFSDGVSEVLLPRQLIDKRAIIICGFGVKEYGVSGIIATALLKLIYQRSLENRDIKIEGPNAPYVMMCLDEFQLYVLPKFDAQFCSTAGGSLVSQLYVSQSLDNLILAMGGSAPESQAKGLLGNLNCTIMGANGSASTNAYGSTLIGSHFVDTTSTSIRDSGNAHTYNQLYHPKVPPSHFTTLSMGATGKVETIIFQVGRKWKSNEDQNFCPVTFTLNS